MAETSGISREAFLDRVAQQTQAPRPARVLPDMAALRAQEQALQEAIIRQEQ